DPLVNTKEHAPDRIASVLKEGIHPCYSGFQVQGSATSPAGMALFHSLLYYYNRKDLFLQEERRFLS
ncbi:MAG: hypothetical protein IJY43_03285, partial [Clostridia bacterium]|nr:hypothetical protein [Clostridia bacterium]